MDQKNSDKSGNTLNYKFRKGFQLGIRSFCFVVINISCQTKKNHVVCILFSAGSMVFYISVLKLKIPSISNPL